MAWFSRKSNPPARAPSAGEIAEARRYPGGCVYRIHPSLDPNGAIPPYAIQGAWKVDAEGRIEGEFIPNKNYDPGKLSS